MVSFPGDSVFGFRVDSEIPFRFLRAGGADHVLRVREGPEDPEAAETPLLFEWRLHDGSREITGRLHESGGIYHFWTHDAGWYRIDPASRLISIPRNADATRREVRLWGVPTLLCFVELGCIPLHASAVAIPGGAVLLAAPGRFGKTTLAMGFHRNGYRVLSEDLSCCRVGPHPVLLPGPASLRLRPDVFDGQVPAGTRLIAVRPDRVFLAVDADRRGDGRPVPIRGIVLLRESARDVVIEPTEAALCLPDLLALTFRIRGNAGLARSFKGLSELAAATPIWNLHRPLRIDRLDEVVRRIVETCEP
jgi:hypothetical protein